MRAALLPGDDINAGLASRLPVLSVALFRRCKASAKPPCDTALIHSGWQPALTHAGAKRPSPDLIKFRHGVLGAVLATAVFGLSSLGPAHGAGGSAKALLLRGAVLPTKTAADQMAVVTIKLASLSPDLTGGGKTRTDVIPRLNYANFRFMTKPAPVKPAGVKMASLHPLIAVPRRKPAKRFSGAAKGFIRWRAYPGCVPKKLKKVLVKLADRFGKLTVNSTHRSAHHNARIGGAKQSFHLKCQAVDFRIKRNSRAAMAFLKRQPVVGGLKHYGGGLFHIDTGRRRTW